MPLQYIVLMRSVFDLNVGYEDQSADPTSQKSVDDYDDGSATKAYVTISQVSSDVSARAGPPGRRLMRATSKAANEKQAALQKQQ